MHHKNSLHLSTHPKYKTQGTELHWKKFFFFKLPYDPAILIIGIYPREIKTYIHINIYKNDHSSLFIISNPGNIPGIQ